MYAGEVVEEASTAELFSHAHHPYTEGLLGAMPRVGGEKDRLATIPGTVPSPTNWPNGCRFRDRCPYSWERCEVDPAEEPLAQVQRMIPLLAHVLEHADCFAGNFGPDTVAGEDEDV